MSLFKPIVSLVLFIVRKYIFMVHNSCNQLKTEKRKASYYLKKNIRNYILLILIEIV